MSATSPKNLHDVSISLSQAVINQNRWNGALQQMADLFDGSFATFELIDKISGTHIQHIDCSDIEIQQSYANHFMPINPRIRFGARPDAPTVLHDYLMMSEYQMDRDPFYADFLAPMDLRYFLSFKAYETSDKIGVFTVQKSANAGAVDKHDIGLLSNLENTLQEVAFAQVGYGNSLARVNTLESLMQASQTGVIVLEMGGGVQEMNESAISMVRLQDGMYLTGGNLALSNENANAKLAAAQATNWKANGQTAGIVRMLVPRPSGLPPYKLTLHQVTEQAVGHIFDKPRLLVLIEDPCANGAIDPIELQETFGFTLAEAQVAILLTKGKVAKEIARINNVSLATVRTQIQQIMQKLSVRRQVDIVRILSRYV